MINMNNVYKLTQLGMAAYHSSEIRRAYLAAQERAQEDVRDLPRDIHRVNLFAERWLQYFAEEYSHIRRS